MLFPLFFQNAVCYNLIKYVTNRIRKGDDSLQPTIIVPSLDPDEKLTAVVEGLLAEGFQDIVLINDGSHADHLAPFENAALHPEVTVLTHEVNKGKGRAMKTAFAWVLENRPDTLGAITVDGDNQHRAKDVKALAEALEREPEKLWLGVRDFSAPQVPARSKLGNKLTRGIMKLACGVSVTDTQTGLRGISRENLPLMLEIEGERYEYETEQLLRLKENNLTAGELVIDTVYIDDNQSSHFNALRDSWKIYRLIFRYMGHRMAKFVRYSLSSIFCFLLDNGLFTLLNLWLFAGLGDRRIPLATFAARAVSSVANYLINRNLVFRNTTDMKETALRYFALVILQAAASALLVKTLSEFLTLTGWLDSLCKILVDALLFFLSYQIQQRWVFVDKTKK